MPKFSGTKRRPLRTNLTAPIRTTRDRIRTHEGGEAFARDPESELFLLAVTNMVGEDTFYERADDRDARFVAARARGDRRRTRRSSRRRPRAGKVGLAQYLRETMLMRSAAIVMAAEYVAAGGAVVGRWSRGALQRADEPAELLGYWLPAHGRNVPMPVKRGIADAVRRLYTERAALRYDGLSRQVRMADVIELTHPSPRDDAPVGAVQVAARPSPPRRRRRRRRRAAGAGGRGRARRGPDGRRVAQLLRDRGPAALADAGFSWERLSGWLPGGMDAEAWEAVIPSMGVMALVRNLRNFDQAGISEPAIERSSPRSPTPTRWPGRGCSRTRCGRRTSTRRRTTGSGRSAARSSSPSPTSRRSTAPSS